MKELLVIIDMQEGFRSREAIGVIPSIQRLLNLFPGEKVFSLFTDTPNSHFEKLLDWKIFQDPANQKILKELAVFDLKKFEHTGYSVLTPKLLQYIKENDFSTVFLCGLYTDVCIIKTAMDLFDLDISVKVVEDACSSLHGKQSHTQAIDTLKHILGADNVVKTADIV